MESKMSKEEILNKCIPYTPTRDSIYAAMQTYSDQQNAELLTRIAQLEIENQMLVDRINEIER